MAAGRKFVRVQEDGLVPLPTGFGLKAGDVLKPMETVDGILLVLQDDPLTQALDGADRTLRDAGVSYDDLIDSGEEIRADLWRERYEDETA